MTIRLNDLSLCPPDPSNGFRDRNGNQVKRRGHWWYYEASTDSWIFGGDYKSLTESVREHLVTNSLPVPADLDGAVQELICAMAPAGWKGGCVEANPTAAPVNYVTWANMKRWFKTMLSYSKDRTLVEQSVAEARASTCLQCRKQVPKAECRTGGCGGSVAGFITQLAIHRSTPYDENLGACGVCGCTLAAMIHFPNEILDRASAGLEYPSDTGPCDLDGNPVPCWRNAG